MEIVLSGDGKIELAIFGSDYTGLGPDIIGWYRMMFDTLTTCKPGADEGS